MATYVNDLRLKEIATGDEAGTWGTSTNTNLELIAEAFSFGTEAITTNADTHTTRTRGISAKSWRAAEWASRCRCSSGRGSACRPERPPRRRTSRCCCAECAAALRASSAHTSLLHACEVHCGCRLVVATADGLQRLERDGLAVLADRAAVVALSQVLGGFGEAWTVWSWLELAGMIVLLLGTAVYNGSLKLPCIGGDDDPSPSSALSRPCASSFWKASLSELIAKEGGRAQQVVARAHAPHFLCDGPDACSQERRSQAEHNDEARLPPRAPRGNRRRTAARGAAARPAARRAARWQAETEEAAFQRLRHRTPGQGPGPARAATEEAQRERQPTSRVDPGRGREATRQRGLPQLHGRRRRRGQAQRAYGGRGQRGGASAGEREGGVCWLSPEAQRFLRGRWGRWIR